MRARSLLTVPILIAAPTAAQIPVGAARVDITPEGPIRLSGYGARSTESEGVEQRLWASAMAIGGEEPVVLVATDLTGVPASLAEEVAARLAEREGLPRERLALTVTHTHTGPMVAGYLDNLFGVDLPPNQAERIAAYTEGLVSKLVGACVIALTVRQPARLAFGKGRVTFGANRRTAGGPSDPEVAVLAAYHPEGPLYAVVVNYACHCTTLGGDFNRVCGDWAGYAREAIQRAHPGVACLVTAGCGGDQNPTPRGDLDHARRYGQALAAEVLRVLAGELAPVTVPPTARLETLRLPFAPARTRVEWEERARTGGRAVAYHARKNLARLDRGESLPTELPMAVQAVTFGEELTWVMLAGEVTVDYALRLKRELDAPRVVVSAYANDVPCYIPSERVLVEGGYEAEGAMVYYDQPQRLAAGLEQKIVDAVHRVVPDAFRTGPPYDATRTDKYAPLRPEYALREMVLGEGLEVRLAAAEPLVVDPVAIDFGPDGRLWVCEMRDYPEGVDGEYAPGGRIVVLEDLDGDAVFDRSTVFLDGIPFPTDVKAWRDGALVCSAPNILFARDTDGDGRADDVEALYKGFETSNYQGRVNSLRLGLDGWLHGANGLFGGTVESYSGTRVELGGRDFRIDPGSGAIETLPGLTQQGRARDDFGNWFGCDNSTLATHYPLVGFDLKGLHVPAPPAEVFVPQGVDPNMLFPIGPPVQRFDEPGHGGRVTSACGLEIYRDVALGEEYYGDLFVCEPVYNLVHRLELEPDGTTFVARRAAGEEQREFLASRDPWFRPVQVRAGPDGALWVVDMARYVIEHPRWLSEEAQAALDLRAGHELGRIWRVVRTDGMPERRTRVDDLSVAELAAALETESGTTRDMALQRLGALARAGAGALESPEALQILRDLIAEGHSPATRCTALHALALWGRHEREHLKAAARDPDPRVRAAALRHPPPGLSPFRDSQELLAIGLADPDLRVRLAAALSLTSPTERPWEDEPRASGHMVGRALRGDVDDPYLRTALLLAASTRLGAVMETAMPAGDVPPHPAVVEGLLAAALAEGDHDAMATFLDRALHRGGAAPGEAITTLGAFFAALDARGTTVSELESRGTFPLRAALRASGAVVREARGIALAPDTPLTVRTEAVAVLARIPEERDGDLTALAELLEPTQPAPLRRAALRASAREEGRVELLFAAWPTLGPELVGPALDAVLARPKATHAFLAWARVDPSAARALDPARQQRLREHPEPALRKLAGEVLVASPTPEVAAELARFAEVDALPGDPQRGAQTYQRQCAACHSLGGIGTPLGPDLAALTDRSTPGLLAAIVDPNRAVLAQYVDYVLQTADGRVLGGIVVEETDAHVRLMGQGGAEEVVTRDAIDQLVSTGRSFMTEGLTAELDAAAVSDLLAFLRAPRTLPRSFPGNRPGVVRADERGEWDLCAAQAEVFGPELIFEAPFSNLGYWHGAADHALWTVAVEEFVELDVWIEWACDDGSAAETFVLAGAGTVLRGVVEGTGSGWSHYRWAKVGELDLTAGRHRFEARAEGDPARSLFDLRRFRFTPRGAEPGR